MKAKSIVTEKDRGRGEKGGSARLGLQTVFSIIASQIIEGMASADNPI